MNNLNPPMPKVTIGMPVYNGEPFIRKALDSLLAQTFTDFELIISDNASTDKTEVICREYAANDLRIRYIRQPENLGGSANFKFVLNELQGDYFMWAACDDVWSPKFLEVNYSFLSQNRSYVSSTSPNGFGNWPPDHPLVNFSLDGDLVDRYNSFFKRCFQSHGIFYSLIRSKIIRDCDIIDNIFPSPEWLGFDWAIILYLASKGKINRASDGYIIFGVNGASSNSSIFRKFNTVLIEWFLPFYRLSQFTISLTRPLPFRQRAKIKLLLLQINVRANIILLNQWLHPLIFVFYPLAKPVWRWVKTLKNRGL